MIDSWILDNLDISFLTNLLFTTDINIIPYYIKKAGIYSAGYGASYSDHAVYSDSSPGGGYKAEYSAVGGGDYYKKIDYGDYGYPDHSNYSQCAYQCQTNQYLSQYIGEPTFAVNDIIIYASLLNNFIQYINKGKDKINELVTTYKLENKYKITSNLQEVAIADIYDADLFNHINAAIQEFINGATNVLNKVKDKDYITITELQTFKTVLKTLKIPPTVPRENSTNGTLPNICILWEFSF